MEKFDELPESIRYLILLIVGLILGFIVDDFWESPGLDECSPICTAMDSSLAGYDWNIDSSGQHNYGEEGNMYSSANDSLTNCINFYTRAGGTAGTGISPDQMTQSVKISWRLLETVIRQTNLSTDTFIYFRFGLIDTSTTTEPGTKMLTIFAGSNSKTVGTIVNGAHGYIYAAPDGTNTFCPPACPLSWH